MIVVLSSVSCDGIKMTWPSSSVGIVATLECGRSKTFGSSPG